MPFFSKLFKAKREADALPPGWAPLPEPAVPVSRRELEAQLPCSPRDIHDFRLPDAYKTMYAGALRLSFTVYAPLFCSEADEVKAALRALTLLELTVLTVHYRVSPPHPRVTPHAEDMIKRVSNGTAPYDMGYRVLNAGAPSPTVTTRFNDPGTWYSVKLPGSEWHGKVTVANGLAIQGFPREWALSGRVMTDRKLVGNAVPPELARRVFEQLSKDPRSFTLACPGRTSAGA